MNKIIVCTVQVETSPQALPLGAACIVTALQSDPRTANLYETELFDFSLEDPELAALPEKADTLQIPRSTADGAVKNNAASKSAATAANNAPGKNKASYIAGKLAARNPVAVCFSVYVWNRLLLCEVAEILRSRFPELIITAGGPEVTARPDSFSPAFNAVFSGAGELSVPEYFSAIAGRTTANATAGIPLTENDAPPQTQNSKPDIIQSRLPDASILSSPYLSGVLDPAKYGGALWELARGCPFACSYCYESKGEKKISYMSMNRIKEELRLFSTKRIPQIFVLDPTYNADKKRALEILQFIKKNAPDIRFNFEVRAEFIDRQLARAFSEISCSLQIGLQSADEAVLKLVHRSFDKTQFAKKIALLNETGAVFGFDLIYGLPGDTLSGFRKSIDYALSLYPNHIELFLLSVLPGTDLYDRADALQLSYERLPPYHVTGTPLFPPEDLRRAASLAQACNLFYSQGRAVSWFLSVLKPLKLKPSLFFRKFEEYIAALPEQQQSELLCNCTLNHAHIEQYQTAFVSSMYDEKKIALPVKTAAVNLIQLYGALSRADGEGEKTMLSLSWHPDDLLTPYAADLFFFTAHVKQYKCKASVYPTPNGANCKVMR